MDFQGDLPWGLGADPAALAELRTYCEAHYDAAGLAPETVFPLPDEPFVAIWEEWARQAAVAGAFPVLRQHLPQLRFPIREGMSRDLGYRAATLRGESPDEIAAATGLELERPASLELALHVGPAGRIPLLIVRHRPDFATVLRALARRNEPVAVPPAQGALMISGYNNWHRLHALRHAWQERPPEQRENATWGDELRQIQARPELYQDRFVLLSDGPYSAVPAADLGLDEAAWREASLALRRDHECAHYLTRRLHGAMRNHLLDELVADYAGMKGAFGHYRADWQLRFLGIADTGYRPGGRLDLYRGEPALSEESFAGLQSLARAAARSLERFDAGRPNAEPTLRDRALTLLAIASFQVDQLAEPGAPGQLAARLAELEERLA